MIVIKHRKIFYALSGIIGLLSLWALFSFGLKPGLDFTGGSLLDVSFGDAIPSAQMIGDKITALGMGESSVRPAGDKAFIIRLKEISQVEKTSIITQLSFNGQYVPTEREFNTIGPVLGREALRKSAVSIVLVLVAIILFITFAFRKVSRPVSSWIYGAVALIALAHDVVVPSSVFAILGRFMGFEVDTLFVTALLVVLGFSIHDTIVVFDRVRENLKNEGDRGSKKPFDQVVGESISQTFVRSINTSLTTILAIAVLYFVGPEATRHFALAMGIGILAGTYSSIFIGSPLLVTINNWKNKK